MIKNITYKKKLLAIIIKGNYEKKSGLHFFTKKNLIQQVAYINHPKNYKIQPHIHKTITRKISGTSEVLIILQGKMKINFFNNKKKFLKNCIVSKKDIVILINGGHGFKMINNCKFIEVKQGPYSKNQDKSKF
tara:strand:- start:274 stop:672 length:399 start_codon:yes stop_codon:yes gene_type:complete